MTSHTSKPHIVVVGAGILGCAIAFHAALRGAQITLVDASTPGKGATHLSFAWLNAYGKEPFHYHDLNRRSLEMWARFARRLGIDITWGGELRWAITEAGASALREQADKLQTWGYPTRLLDAPEVAKLEPNLQTDGLIVASYSDLEGQVNTAEAVRAMTDLLTAQGAEIAVQTEVTGLEVIASTGGRQAIASVRIDGGSIDCDAVVLAGGKAMPHLANMAEVELPLRHTRGITIVTEPLPPLFENVALVHSPRDGTPLINLRQFRDGSVMVQSNGQENYSEGDRGESNSEAEQIVREAAAFVPALATAQIAEVRRGRRPIPQDGEPIIGFADSVENLYLASTHSGVTLAPIIGEMAAIELVNGVSVELLAPFRIERFA